MRRTALLASFLRVAFLLALVAGFVVALLPAPDLPRILDWQDKVEHFVFFLLLTLLGLAAWPRRRLAVPLGLIAYGLAMELAQSFTGYRIGDPWDWVADSLGIAAGVAIAHAARRLRAGAAAQ